MKKFYTAEKSPKTSKSSQGPDRRRYPRFDFPFFIRYKKDEHPSQADEKRENILFVKEGEELAISHNVSIGGICFATKELLPRLSKLTVEIFTPIKSEPFTALAEVVWQKKRVLSLTYLTGISFLKLDDEKEFTHLLHMLTEMKLEKIIER